MNFNGEELMLMMLYNPGTRLGLIFVELNEGKKHRRLTFLLKSRRFLTVHSTI